MARRPNYDFERRQREKLKAEKVAQKAEAKRLLRDRDGAEPDAEASDEGDSAGED